jgi:hypothetical protein
MMPSTRHKRTRNKKGLKPWEYAFLTGDESKIEPGSRDAARLEVMKRDPDSRLMFGDRTANELIKEYPQYAKH